LQHLLVSMMRDAALIVAAVLHDAQIIEPL
jgi:hypothetical protein